MVFQIGFKAVQRSVLCRSRQELSNAYLVAKIGFDTAENEPAKKSKLSKKARYCAALRERVGLLRLAPDGRLLQRLPRFPAHRAGTLSTPEDGPPALTGAKNEESSRSRSMN